MSTGNPRPPMTMSEVITRLTGTLDTYRSKLVACSEKPALQNAETEWKIDARAAIANVEKSDRVVTKSSSAPRSSIANVIPIT